MKLIVLGSGTCVPSLKRNAPGYYIETKGFCALVDCGSGSLLQLERAGRSYKDIDAVFITHRHPDHFTDLMPLVHALIATPGFKREKDLAVIAPEGFKEYYDRAVGSIIRKFLRFNIRHITAEDRFDLGPFNIFTAKTVHSSDSMAYRIEHNGASVVFMGDADYDQGIIGLSENADILVADCSFPDSMKTRGHLCSKECGLIAQKADVGKLLLSHIYPADCPDEDRVAESKQVFSGEVVLAEDLMEFIL